MEFNSPMYNQWYKGLRPGDEVYYYTGRMQERIKLTTVSDEVREDGKVRTADGELFDTFGMQCTGYCRSKLYKTSPQLKAAEQLKEERERIVAALRAFDFTILAPSKIDAIMEVINASEVKEERKMIKGVIIDAEQHKVADERTPIFRKLAYVKPIANHYEDEGEAPYIKYNCPVCELIGHKHQVTEGFGRCWSCGVNLIWEGDRRLDENSD